MNNKNMIEKIARDMCSFSAKSKCCECSNSCYFKYYAKKLVDKDYRKAAEVALEVIRKAEQIVEVKVIGIEEDLFHNTALYGDVAKKNGFEEVLVELAELKKKYTESSKETTEGEN